MENVVRISLNYKSQTKLYLFNTSTVPSNHHRTGSVHFNVAEYMHEGGHIMELLIKAWRDGQIVVSDDTESIFESRFEHIPQTWLRLFDGANKGTKLV